MDTYGGKVQLRWDAEAAVTAFGQMPYFIEFLKTAGLFDDWVEDCPLDYRSPNAPHKRDVQLPPFSPRRRPGQRLLPRR